MDFEELEQLVLKVLFETDVPVTAAHIAYLGRISVRQAERHLARMVEHGTLLVRTGSTASSTASSTEGVVEYYYPGRKPIAAASSTAVGPPAITLIDPFLISLRPSPSPITSVLLSMLIPGAGHIYSGRAGSGVAWMATTLMGYACFFLPGLFLHGLCLVSAARMRRA
jgi:TM2 domain-containing membrane protein YozV